MGIGRKLERNRMKEDYRKFCQTWELARQLENDLGRQYREAKRPSFKVWAAKVKEMRTAVNAVVNDMPTEDLEWED